MSERAASAAIRGIMRDAIVWDSHACMPLRPEDATFLPQLARHKAAGASFVSLNVGFGATPLAVTLKLLEHFRRWLRQHPREYVLAENTSDIERARREGRMAVAFDLEGCDSIQDDPDRIRELYGLGVRWMLLTYNINNRLGGGCQDQDTGLTAQGRRFLAAMREAGVVLCCSHTGERTVREAIDYIERPVIFSHSNPRAVHDHPRNISDDLMHACARSGGVVNLSGIGIFLGRNDTSTRTFVKHVNYVAERVGPEHVGLGLDYVFDHQELDDYLRKHPDRFPAEHGYGPGMRMVEPEQLPEIAEELLRYGWTEAALRGFLGENNLRVARQVWRA